MLSQNLAWPNYGRVSSTVRLRLFSENLCDSQGSWFSAGFWMSDKPLVQQALATDLAEIILSIPSAQGALDFLRGFWETIVREWKGIDQLR